MKKNSRKNLYSVLIVAGFWAMATASSVNKIHCGAFSYSSDNEENDTSFCVVLKDGKKVYGERIVWRTGLAVKDIIKIDDQKFNIRDTRGYFDKGVYYGRIGGEYAKRIIRGKLNVYYTSNTVSTMSTNVKGQTKWSTRTVCLHYVQIGEEGELNPIADQKDIIKYVKDCPKTVEMIDKKNSQIRKAIRKNGSYLNDIFATYNNGCQ